MGRLSFVHARLAATLLVLVATVAACANLLSSDDGTRVRLRNASSFELTAVTFASGQASLEYARIAPGETTDYVRVENAYSYGMLDVLVGGQHRRIQPIDFVGESYIGDGKFTYVITVDAGTRNPQVALVEE